MTKLETRKRPKTLPPNAPPPAPAPDIREYQEPPEPAPLPLSYPQPPLIALAWAGLLARDDGWLRVIPHEQGKIVYFKWKFTRGPHAGRYVMYVDASRRLDEPLAGLLDKLAKVDVGALRPTADHPYE